MNHLIVMPVLLPALAAAVLVMLGDARRGAARAVSAGSTLALLGVAVLLFADAASGQHTVYAIGAWQPPFGIVLVLDRLSALLVLLTALVAFAALLHAIHGWDTRGRFFHALFQFQLMGLNGAFLTGDLFNLFVFFEVLLIASYCLMLHGLGLQRLRATVHYVAINLAGSAVFLIAVSILYGMTGTLNMAHLAERVAEAAPEDLPLLRTGALLLVGVFGIKAAVFPLYFWLPSAYSSASAPVAALFSIMTKVGIYAIVRVTTLIFGLETVTPWLLPVALVTLTLGMIGALGAHRLALMVAYFTIGSVGTTLVAVVAGGTDGLSASLYYLVHSTLAIAALFLLTELLAQQRGALGDALRPGPVLRQPALLGLAFLVSAVTVVGIPPSSGFLGKLMVLDATRNAPETALTWGVILVTSLLAIVACARAGTMLLWNVGRPMPAKGSVPVSGTAWVPLVLVIAAGVLVAVFAAPLRHYADATAAQLLAPADYVTAVLQGTPERVPRALGGVGATR